MILKTLMKWRHSKKQMGTHTSIRVLNDNDVTTTIEVMILNKTGNTKHLSFNNENVSSNLTKSFPVVCPKTVGTLPYKQKSPTRGNYTPDTKLMTSLTTPNKAPNKLFLAPGGLGGLGDLKRLPRYWRSHKKNQWHYRHTSDISRTNS